MRRSAGEKRQIVEEAMQPDASVARVARARGVNANQVFQWRRQYRRGLLGSGNTEAVSLLPVRVTEALAREGKRHGRAGGPEFSQISSWCARKQTRAAVCDNYM